MTRRRCPDLSLYLVAGPDDVGGRPVVEVVLDAVRGGVTIVQLRRKDHAARAFVEQARALAGILRPRGIPLIINDRVDVAIAADADGVHIGQDDIAPADARRLLGEHSIIGLSVTSLVDAHALDPALADYAGVGPVFATPSKPDAAPPLGLDGLGEACAVLGVPAVAIGGVTRSTAGAVIEAGAAGIAVVSAICGASDPRHAARELSCVIADARSRRETVRPDVDGVRPLGLSTMRGA